MYLYKKCTYKNVKMICMFYNLKWSESQMTENKGNDFWSLVQMILARFLQNNIITVSYSVQSTDALDIIMFIDMYKYTALL